MHNIKSSSKPKGHPQKRMHESEWRNSWLSSWIGASILILITVKIMEHSIDGIMKWTFVVALAALAGSLGLYGLLNLILFMQKKG